MFAFKEDEKNMLLNTLRFDFFFCTLYAKLILIFSPRWCGVHQWLYRVSSKHMNKSVL